MRDKLTKLKKLFKNQTENFLFLDYEDPHHFWLLGKELKNSYMLIRRTGKPILLISPLENYKNPDFIIKPFEKENLPSKVLVNKSSFKIKYKSLFRIKEIEINIRDVKSKKEILFIKKACSLADECFNLIWSNIKKKKYKKEKDIEQEINLFAAKNNLELAFKPIVASGKNSSIPHHDNSSKLTNGFLVIDLGFKYKGYCSDATRTFYLGKPSKKEKELYELVLQAQQKIISDIYPGVQEKTLKNNIEEYLKDEHKHFIHSLGHGIGVEVHEFPLIGKTNTKLKENQVITIEPGVYKKQGIRIEDVVVVAKKPEILTGFTKDLLIANL